MPCWASPLLSLQDTMAGVGIFALVLLCAEVFWAHLAARGRAASRGVLFPVYRKLLFVYVAILGMNFGLLEIGVVLEKKEYLSIESRVTAFLDQSSSFAQFVVLWWLLSLSVYDTILLVYLASDSGGMDAMWRAFRWGGVAAAVTTFAWLLLLTTHSWIPVLVLRILSIGVCMALAIRSLAPGRRKCLLVVAPGVALALFAVMMTYSAREVINDEHPGKSCVFQSVYFIATIIQPIVLYVGFRIDMAHWRSVVGDVGFSTKHTRSLVEPMVSQLFPSAMLMEYDAFKLGECLGKGTQAAVFKATFRARQTFALKRYTMDNMTPAVVQDFLSEALALYRTPAHENVLGLSGVVIAPPHLCLVTELCELSLMTWLKQQHKRQLREPNIEPLLRVALNVARGLAHLHAQNPPILHRDLKSLNILLKRDKDSRYAAKVADMGSCKLLEGTPSRRSNRNRLLHFLRRKFSKSRKSVRLSAQQEGPMTELTDINPGWPVAFRTTRAGTVPWIAPEALSGTDYDLKSDVYSFGVVLWEIMACNDPFTGVGRRISASECLQGFRLPFAPLMVNDPQFVQPIMDLISACWAQDAKSRPKMPEVVEALERLAKMCKKPEALEERIIIT